MGFESPISGAGADSCPSLWRGSAPASWRRMRPRKTSAAAGERFDLVLAMEVIEHTPDPAAFVAAAGELAETGGAVALATLNRTLKSFAHAILGAEFVLGWLPRGSHRWGSFVRPGEIARYMRAAGLRLDDLQGVGYGLGRGWRLSADCGVNYMVFAVKG